jgi:predicted MFS family arabinose efflux permease
MRRSFVLELPKLSKHTDSPERPGESEGTFQLTQIGQILLLATATWTATYARYTTGPLQEAMHQAMSISDNRMAVLQASAVAIPMVIGAILVGLLADRISRKTILLVAPWWPSSPCC